MDFKEFMRTVDKQLLLMSEEEKSAWIHDMGRKQTESQRETFLDSLKRQPLSDEQSLEYSKEIREIENWLLQIKEQEIHLKCSYYEEYGESYWDRYEGYVYEDPFDIGANLIRAFQLAEKLLMAKNYRTAADLYDSLCSIPISAYDIESEVWLEDGLDLESLVEEEIVNLDLKQIGLRLLYAQYQVTPLKKRPAVLFRYLSWGMCEYIKMEEVFTVGPRELLDSDAFMQEWSAFLEKTPGNRAGELLTEACIYNGGIESLCETAEKVAELHPILYKNACSYLYDHHLLAECETIGLKAIEKVPASLLIRGNIADIAVKAAVQLDHKESIRQLYEAAFYSNSSILHYLRLFKLSDYKEIVGNAAEFAQSLPEKFYWSGSNANVQMNENWLSAEHKKVIRFFNHEFDLLQELCKKDKKFLGWSTSFKGIIVPLFLLMMDKSEGISRTKEIVIRKLESKLGAYYVDNESFLDYFYLWKKTVELTPEQVENYLVWLDEEVAKRTDAVVGGGHRNSYHKAAELIVLLSEAAESNGKLGEKSRLVEYYKKAHSRKRAFKEELDNLY